MQDNGVGRGGQFIGDGEQGVGAKDAQGSQENPPVEPQGVPGYDEVASDDQQGDGGAAAVDGHTSPGDELDAQAANAVKQGGDGHEHGSSVLL